MEFLCITQWDQLPDSANTLFSQYENESLFFSRPWFENLIATTLEHNHSMLLACVFEGDDTLAIFPLIQSPDGHLSSLAHTYSSLYTLLLADKNQSDVLACLAEGLNDLSASMLSLKPFDPNDNNINKLQHALEKVGFSCHRGFRFYNWIYRVDGETFDEYMSKRPAILRNTIKRKQRKLAREHGYEIRLFTDENSEQALTDYTIAYNASWKAHEQYNDIIKGLVERFARQGWLRLAVLYVDGLPIAAQLWFVVGKKASIFRLAYQEDWKQYSPGSVLTHYLMHRVIDTDKVDEIDFLTGNEKYKQDWMSERRERWGMTCGKKPLSKVESDDHQRFKRFRHVLSRLGL